MCFCKHRALNSVSSRFYIGERGASASQAVETIKVFEMALEDCVG